MKTRAAMILPLLLAIAATAVPAGADVSFGEPEFYAECTPFHYPTRVRLFDMDGDGVRDLVIPGRDREKKLNWCRLNGDGTPGPMQTVDVDGQTDDVVAADVDGDGQQELVLVIRAYAGRLQIMHRASNGLMVAGALIPLDREPRSIVAGDFDGDGRVDFAVSCYGSEHVAIVRNGPGASFAVSQRIRVDAWSGGTPGPQDVQAADLDDDGRADLVVGCIGTRRLDVFFGQPGGTFRSPVSWVAPDFPGSSKPAVVSFDLGDIDNDGDVDILAPLLSTGAGQPLVVFRNDGHGGFGNAVMVGQGSGGYHWGALLADLDADGDLDAVSSSALPGNIWVWRNDSTPAGLAFGAPNLLGYSSFARHFLAVNVDGDCDPDLLEADIGGNYVMGYPNLRNCFSSMSATRTRAEESVAAFVADARTLGDSPACALARQLAAFGPEPGAAPNAASLVPPAACGPSGGGGRCDEPHETPGCFTTPCCEKVCGIAPDCCVVAWDQTCVDVADSECNGLVCPSYGPCNVVHADPGCEDPDCCGRVTPLDGYCDGATWDWVCVARAGALCGLPPCTVAVPAGAAAEEEVCYKNLNDGATRDGESMPLSAGQTIAGTCTTGAPRDTDWYSLGSGAGVRTVRLTLDAEFPAELHVMQGAMAGPLRTVSIAFGGRCSPIVAEFPVDGDQWYAVVTLGQDAGAIRSGQPCTLIDPENPPPPDEPPVEPGFDGNAYWIRHECISCTGQVFGDLNGDGVVSGTDLGLLLGQFGVPNPQVGDLNHDGAVTGADIGLMLGAWTVG